MDNINIHFINVNVVRNLNLFGVSMRALNIRWKIKKIITHVHISHEFLLDEILISKLIINIDCGALIILLHL